MAPTRSFSVPQTSQELLQVIDSINPLEAKEESKIFESLEQFFTHLQQRQNKNLKTHVYLLTSGAQQD